MMKNEKVKDVAKLLDLLNEKDLEELVNDVYSRLVSNRAQPSMSRAFDKTAAQACVNCGSVHFVKNGKDRKGNARYLCRDCGKSFTALTDTTLCGTRKEAVTWKTYVESLLEGCSLEECAKRCGICKRSAFSWRHKILSALSENSFAHSFSGLLELDETFIRISYKGNHKNSKNFTMPRKAHKRGSDGHDAKNLNNSKVSVLCVVERGKGFSGVIPCRGIINRPLLESLFSDRLSDESVVMTDGLRAYKQYFDTTKAQHIVLPRQPGTHKPTVNGPYHINNVNAMHKRFHEFLEPYHGVSTKFLNNYLTLFLWKENHKGADNEALICNAISTAGTYVSENQLRNLTKVPEFAPKQEQVA